MKRFLIFLVFVLAGTLFACEGSVTAPPPPPPAPAIGVVSGVVRDARSSEPLVGASVMWGSNAGGWSGTGHLVTTDADGRYRMPIYQSAGSGSGTSTINVRAMKAGYAPRVAQVDAVGEVTLDFALGPPPVYK